MNKKLISMIFTMCCIGISATAQTTTTTSEGELLNSGSLGGTVDAASLIKDVNDLRLKGYLFGQYENAKVKFRNGDVLQSKMNYFAGGEKFHFLDNAGKTQELANFDKIEYVEIQNRVFYFDEYGEALELICKEPRLFAIYKCDVSVKGDIKAQYRDQNAEANYGFHSKTNRENTAYGSDRSSQVKLSADQFKFGGMKCNYKLDVNGKTKKFKDLKGFLKIFNKEQRPEIEKFANEHQTNFNNPTQVIELVQFALTQG
mgnify:FL=1